MQHPLLKQKASSSLLSIENPRDYVPMHVVLNIDLNATSEKEKSNTREEAVVHCSTIWDAPIYRGRDGEIW